VSERILSDVKSEIEQGVAFALASPSPKPNQITDDVYA
jgi:TPP-dependent pyruvate/acetoin dehydrogenase alpha subunit